MKALYFFYFVAFPDGEPVPTSPGNALACIALFDRYAVFHAIAGVEHDLIPFG